MGVRRNYRVAVTVEVEIGTDSIENVADEALTKITSIMGRRNTAEGREEYAKALESINIYKEN